MTRFMESQCETSPGGLRLHLRMWGPSTGRPVVISHGFLEQCAAWDFIAEHLGRRVVTYDQRGHGLSEHVGTDGFYHFFDYVSDLDAIARQLGEPFDLIGHSMGGTVACLFTALRPESVHKLVLIEGVGPPDSTQLAVQRGRQFLNHREHPPQHRPFDRLEDGIERMLKFNQHLSPEDAKRLATRHTLQQSDGTWTWRWDSKHRSRSPRPFSNEQFKQYIKGINHPTLLIFGSTSFYQGMADLEDRIRAFPNANTVTLEGVGHHPHHQCPNLLLETIQKHLQD